MRCGTTLTSSWHANSCVSAPPPPPPPPRSSRSRLSRAAESESFEKSHALESFTGPEPRQCTLHVGSSLSKHVAVTFSSSGVLAVTSSNELTFSQCARWSSTQPALQPCTQVATSSASAAATASPRGSPVVTLTSDTQGSTHAALHLQKRVHWGNPSAGRAWYVQPKPIALSFSSQLRWG